MLYAVNNDYCRAGIFTQKSHNCNKNFTTLKFHDFDKLSTKILK